MADYGRLIDGETWNFIRETERWYPVGTHGKNIAEQRRIYDDMCRAFHRGYPAGVTAQDMDVGGVAVRGYRHAGPTGGATVLFAHGGSFMLGGLGSHDDICAEICAATGFEVVAVDYRLLPENRCEDALDDVQRALDWVRGVARARVVLVGDSAGGYLCASVVHGRRDVAGQVLIYPGLGGVREGGSMVEHAFAPMLTAAEVAGLQPILASEPDRSRYVVPLASKELAGLPPTVAISAECDPLADDARDYVATITQAGGQAIWIEDKGLVHGHLRARHSVQRARRSFDRVVRAISLLGSGQALDRAAIVG